MDQCTHEVRAEYWKKIIQACGQSAKSWMDGNGICEQSYYHWQRRFRKEAYEEMKGIASVPAVPEKTRSCFCLNSMRCFYGNKYLHGFR